MAAAAEHARHHLPMSFMARRPALIRQGLALDPAGF
jgi:hypothetical protein